MDINSQDIFLLGSMYDQLDNALIILNEQFHLQYLNDHAKKLLGLTESDLPIGTQFQDVIIKHKVPITLNKTEKSISSMPIKINSTFKKVKMIAGKVDDKCVFFIVDKDVTEQENTYKILEKSLKDVTGQSYSERVPEKRLINEITSFLEKIIKQMPCYIYWKDEDLRYVSCNDLTAEIMGLSSTEEVIGKTDYDFGWDKLLVDGYRATDIKILSSGIPIRNLSEDLIDKNNRLYHTLVNKLPIKNESGKIIGLLGITVDITEIQEMQLSLKQAKELAEAANIAKTEFIANMSHDIRTPLTGVIGMSEPLEHTLQNPADKQKAHLLHESGEELLLMLNEILDDVRAGTLRETDVKDGSFDLHQCIGDLIRLESPVTSLKGLQLKADIAPDVPRYIRSDHNKIHRILLNLMGNAIKFTQSGSITLVIECLHRDEQKAHLKFGVSDTGIGIPQAVQAQVFNRFFKVTSSYKGLYEGHGLGLHIAQSYVELMGGHITLTSKEGVGSTFHFDVVCGLGVAPVEPQKQAPTLLIPSTPNKAAHLLLVEDNLMALKTLEFLLSQKKYTFASATTGEEGWALLNEQHFDLMITDIGLPGISGNELTHRVRKHEQSLNKPPLAIIGLTGHARETALEECIESGMNEVQSKPAQIEQLHQCIQKLIHPTAAKEKPLAKTTKKATLGAGLPDTQEELFALEPFALFDEAMVLAQIPDKQVLIGLLNTYLSAEMQQDIALMKQEYQQKNWEQIEKLAHKIKGGVVYLGTEKMRYACQYLERYYKAGHRSLLDPLYGQLIEVDEQTNEALKLWLQQNTN